MLFKFEGYIMRKIIFTALLVISIAGSYAVGLFGLMAISKTKSSSGSVQFPIISGNEKIVNEESAVIDVAKKVSPSVVSVAVVGNPSSNNGPFGLFFAPPATPQGQQAQQDIGSGFIVSADGLIVTNKHVVSDTSVKYRVVTSSNKTFDVTNIYRDPNNDVAILKINTSGLTPVNMGDSSTLSVGQMAIAIGTALGSFPNTVTLGVVSGLGRGIVAGSPFEGSVEKLDNVIQTDAAINPGNSGGPLVNSSGQVVGINVATSQSGQNIGFAIPINVVKQSLTQFNQTGMFRRPYLGISYTVLTPDIASSNSSPEGALIEGVTAGSPAEKAGVAANDIITKIDGTTISQSASDVSQVVASKSIGQSIIVTVWRNGQTKNLTLVVGENNGTF